MVISEKQEFKSRPSPETIISPVSGCLTDALKMNSWHGVHIQTHDVFTLQYCWLTYLVMPGLAEEIVVGISLIALQAENVHLLFEKVSLALILNP